MGDAGHIDEAVADAGPLTHLAQIDCLDLLGVFGRVLVPNAVWLETVGTGHVPETELMGTEVVERHDDPSVLHGESGVAPWLGSLHHGERSALLLCQELGVGVILTDDLAVRDAAQASDLTPVGSLGIVLRAHRAGLVSGAEAAERLRELHSETSLYVTQAIVEMAIEKLDGAPDSG